MIRLSSMQTLGWLSVGLTYALMVWGNWVTTTNSSLGLSPGLSTGLLIVTTLLFSGLIAMSCVITWKNPVVKNPAPKVRRLALAGLGGLFVQFCLGSFVRTTHSGLACPNFPVCLESFFPIPFTFETGIAFFHRWWGVLLLGLFFHLAITTAKQLPILAGPARRALGLSVAQVFLGVGTVLSGLSTHSRAFHAAVGYALWGILFFIAVRVGGIPPLWKPSKSGR